MRPKERKDSGDGDLFRSRLDQIVDLNHSLAKLSRLIDWNFLEEELGLSLSRRSWPSPFANSVNGGTGDPQIHA